MDDKGTGKKITLFVGRSGNGLKSCVETIVHTKGHYLQAIKSAGIGDTGNDATRNKTEALTEVLEVMKSFNGIDAIVLVLKYGQRFTKQEKDAVDMVKYVFGENVLQARGIIAFTYGDNFTEDNKNIEFEEWCDAQIGDMEGLFKDWGKRRVLFDNKSRDEKSVEQLERIVSSIYKNCGGNKFKTQGIVKGSFLHDFIKYSQEDTKVGSCCFIL